MLNINKLSYSYDDKEVLKNISFKVKMPSLVSVIGSNNCGKTTLIKCLSGVMPINEAVCIDDIILNIVGGVCGYLLYVAVMKENEYLLRTIEVEKEQKVIDTGLYGIVRHPMYLATILLFLSMPLILGSIISFIIFLVYPFIIAKRIKNEEEVLEKELKGYKEYRKKVKYKLIPFIW